MAEYYHYLWSTTWPILAVIFVIWGFILWRLVWEFFNTWRNEHDVWGFMVLTGKTLLWTVVLGIYIDALFVWQPDWLARPCIIQGSVFEKAYDSKSSSYILEIRSGSRVKKLYIDRNLYEQLKASDQVKLTYLPIRQEVIRCDFIKDLHYAEINTKIGIPKEE